MLFSSFQMKSLITYSFHANFVNLQAQMKCIHVLYFLLIVATCSVYFVTYMLILF